MSQAAKLFDLVIGVDLHMVVVPTPAGGVPTPLPHPFVGYVFDPMGALSGVLVNYLPAANTGTHVKALSSHIPTPPGVAFFFKDVPGNEGSIVTGSKTVSFGGSSAARQGSMVTTCNFPLNLPTSTLMAVPVGKPVIVGGPDAMDWMAAVTQGIRTKWFADTLRGLLNPGKFLNWLICTLTGHPVDVMTGRVHADAVDFELPGPIPLVFERNYDSRDRYEGPLGPAWHHPLDVSVNEIYKFQPLLEVRLRDGRRSPHDALDVGQSVWDPIDRYTLLRTKIGYRLTFWDGRAYHFEPVKGAHVTHPLVKITDRCDNAVELHYLEGRLASVKDSVGRWLRFQYAGGRLAAVCLLKRSAEQWVDLVRYGYDAEGRLAAAEDPAGHACRYAYKGGVLVKETNRNGLSFHFEYQWTTPTAGAS